MKIKSEHIEILLLAVYSGIFLFIGIGNMFDHTISHPYPVGLLASDTYHYYNYMESYEERGIWDYFHYSFSYNISNRIAFQPPLYYIDSVLMGNSIGVANYDSMNLVMMFMLWSGSILMYFVLRRINWKVAILSLPLTYFIFMPNFIFGIIWGRQPTMFTQIFLTGIFWVIPLLSRRLSFVALGILFAALPLGHTPQLLWGAVFVGVYYVFAIIKARKIPISLTLKLGGAAAIALFLSVFYINIFRKTVGSTISVFGKVTPAFTGNRYVSVTDFKIFVYIIALGLLIFLIIKKRNYLYPSLFMMLVGFTNFFLGKRGIESRFMWPIFLCGFLGVSVYYLLQFFRMHRYPLVIGIIFVALSFFILSNYYNSSLTRGSLADSYHWEALSFIRENTPERSKIFYGYGDPYDQKPFTGHTLRLNYIAEAKFLVEGLEQGKLLREYKTDLSGESHDRCSYYDGKEVKFCLDNFTAVQPRDICNYDYYVFDRGGRQPQLAQYSIRLANELIASGNFTIFFQNDVVIILQNNAPGSDCIPVEGVPL